MQCTCYECLQEQGYGHDDLDHEIEAAIAADPDGVENERLRAEAYTLNAAADPDQTQRLIERGMHVVNRLLARKIN